MELSFVALYTGLQCYRSIHAGASLYVFNDLLGLVSWKGLTDVIEGLGDSVKLCG